jgi:hypothetical protein
VKVRGRGAENSNIFGVVGVRAMREIEARDIHTGAQQTLDDARRAAGRANGTDDFGVAKSHLFVDRKFGNDVQ